MDNIKEKDKIFLMRIHPDNTEQVLTDIMDNSNVERGLVFHWKGGSELFNKIKDIQKKGYFFCGVVIGDNDKEIEVMFQRHPKQTESQKYIERKTPEGLKYKI